MMSRLEEIKMSKKRLEEIRKRFKDDREVAEYAGITLTLKDYDWLIEQVERVQELEKDIKEWEIVNESWEEINTDLVEQNKRYREVIKKAIDDLENECLWDALVALKALEES